MADYRDIHMAEITPDGVICSCGSGVTYENLSQWRDHATMPTVPDDPPSISRIEARENLLRAALRVLSAEREEEHAHAADETDYAYDELEKAATELTRILLSEEQTKSVQKMFDRYRADLNELTTRADLKFQQVASFPSKPIPILNYEELGYMVEEDRKAFTYHTTFGGVTPLAPMIRWERGDPGSFRYDYIIDESGELIANNSKSLEKVQEFWKKWLEGMGESLRKYQSSRREENEEKSE